MPQFQPVLFVGVGETMAFFTLRETYEHTVYIPGDGPGGNAVVNGVYQGQIRTEIRSFHHFNLSQDPVEAVAKAKEASYEKGIPFHCTAEKIEEEMREIKRRTEDEIEKANKLAAEEKAAYKARVLERKMQREADLIQAFEDSGHRMPLGQYQTNKVSEVPRSYCKWVINNMAEFTEYSFMLHLAKTIKKSYKDRIPEQVFINPTAYFGEIKKRYDLQVTVAESFSFEGAFGRCYVTKMADADGHNFVVISGAFSAEVGDKLSIKGTVKDHQEYKGQAQTILQRVKVIS